MFFERIGELRAIDLEHPSAAELAQAAVALHHAYGAIEGNRGRGPSCLLSAAELHVDDDGEGLGRHEGGAHRGRAHGAGIAGGSTAW